MADLHTNGLHNTARQRLARPAVAPHPDADLLAAFAEGALRGSERDQVLAHLAACGDCREVVMLAAPEEAEAAAVAEVAPSRGWASWYRLRWGAVAASIVLVAAAALVYRQGNPTFQPTSNRAERAVLNPPAIPEKKAETTATPAPPATIAREHALKPAQIVTARKDEEQLAERDEKVKQQPPAAPTIVNGQLASNGPLAKKPGTSGGTGGGVITARSTPTPTNEVSPASVPKSTDASVTATTETVEVSGTAAAIATDKTESTKKRDTHNAYSGQVLEVAPVPPTANTQRMRAVSPHWQWRVTDAGALERSTDTKHWQALPLNAGVRFLAVVASGTEVWAGGSGGALYRSTDDGAHWTKVALASTADVKGLTLTAPDHVLVTTAEGTQAVAAPQP